MDYATMEDLETLWKGLTEHEKTKAQALISEASAKIRIKAKKQNKDFDDLYLSDSDLATVTKGVICMAVKNAMNAPVDQEAMTQASMSAGGYSWSGTFANPGGGIRFTKKDWSAIGLGSQTYGGLDIYGH